MIGLALVELVLLGVPVGLLVIAVTRNRPSAARFARVRHLTLDDATAATVESALARSRRGRVRGAWAGFVAGVAVGLGLAAATRIGGTVTTALGATAGILVGTFVGVASAERAPRPEAGAPRAASLAVRDVNSYRTRHGTALVRAAAASFVVAVAAVLLTASHEVTITVTATFVIACGGLAFVVWTRRICVGIVERTRITAPPLDPAVDDGLRACAVRSIQHATVGVLACGVGVLALFAIATASYQAVKIDGRTVFEVPDGGHLDAVCCVHRYGSVTIRWIDRSGVRHSAVRAFPPNASLASGTWVDDLRAVGLGSIALLLGWFVGLVEWSAASKAWRRPAAPRETDPEAAATRGAA